MPRPSKRRTVCQEPNHFLFGPLGMGDPDKQIQNLTVDEFECIRLMDIDKWSQEEVALQMNVARTTIQRMYEEARKKIAMMLVEGHYILVSGGNYQLCDHQDCPKCKHKNNHHQESHQEEEL
ncbi:MAG: DUF134 domain-containing protein [Candidatus Izemoplasmatales bacterium]|jgi:predicted DNA-binding protein (UPF0251 family)|nr:DUF134 domain-containing protein [Candidatus Izemoplasmatales bacterium]